MRNHSVRPVRHVMWAVGLVVALLALMAGAVPAGAAAVIAASPASLNFGEVRVGSLMLDETTKVTFTNTGDTPATVGEITNEGGQDEAFAGLTGINPDTFEADPAYDCLKEPDGITPRVLAPTETCTVFVLAYPVQPGTNTTLMTMKDELGNTLVSVTLSAVGTEGYYVTGAFGEILEFGDAMHYGDTQTLNLNAPIIDIKQVPFGEGYWQLGLDGGVFSFGPNARFNGSTGGMQLNQPVVAMDAVSAEGYYTAALDGGVFAFGPDAPFLGSMGGVPLNQPVVGIAVDPIEDGYWLVAADGGVFAFGTAGFHGSMGGQPLNEPIVGIMSTPTGEGYWLVASDGGVFAFGDAVFRGSLGGTPTDSPIVDLAGSPTGLGYWMLSLDGDVFASGDAPHMGNADDIDLATGITGTAPPTDVNGFGDGGFYVSVNDQSAGVTATSARGAAAKAAFSQARFAGVRALNRRQ